MCNEANSILKMGFSSKTASRPDKAESVLSAPYNVNGGCSTGKFTVNVVAGNDEKKALTISLNAYFEIGKSVFTFKICPIISPTKRTATLEI